MDSRKVVEQAVQTQLKGEGFRKKRLSWWRTLAEVVHLLSFQKSAYSDLYYVNCGVLLRGLSDEERPPDYRCHLRTRADSLEAAKPLAGALAFTDAREDLGREERISALVENVALPWLNSMRSEEQVRVRIESDPSGALATIDALRFLGLEP